MSDCQTNQENLGGKTMKRNLLAILFCIVSSSVFAADPLPSWNDGPAKQSIIAFVTKVTTAGSPDFAPTAERIATFDNDGTLWSEQPPPAQLFFALDRVKALAPQHPEWNTKEPFASLLAGWTVVSMKNDWNTVFPTDIVAIDILLQPDAAMLQHAAANNARLLGVFPKGFALDEMHTPHITMLQCFVRKEDLPKLYAAEEKVLADANVNAMKLEAFKLYYIPTGGGLGVAGIVAKVTPELRKLQAEIIDAATPFNLRGGPIGAFTAPHDDPAIDAGLIDYVSKFEQIGAGEHFNPHVSTGNAPTAYLDQLIAEPFESFNFSPAGAVYQLGPFGTAAKKLIQWDLNK
jgi:hypothetical protein